MQNENLMQQENYLGIDWGVSKIGLALAHAETRVAVAYDVLENSETFIDNLRDVIKREGIGTIVVGQPQYQDNHGGALIQKFGKKLSQCTELPVFFTSEMFTTKLAQRTLALRGEKYPSTADDAEAARILLQDWLDRK